MARVIHISGTPGSGKTTLGRSLTGVAVIDTDELISEAEGQELTELRNSGKHVEALVRWKELFLGNLQRARNETRGNTLVFTGILNHWSPDDTILEMPFPNVEKYFIHLPLEQLVRQFYLRYSKEVDDDEFWSGVASQRYNIPGSVEYLAMYRKEKLWHAEHGYEMLSPPEITQRVRSPQPTQTIEDYNTVDARFETIAARDCFLLELRDGLQRMFITHHSQVDPIKESVRITFRPRWRDAPLYAINATLIVKK